MRVGERIADTGDMAQDELDALPRHQLEAGQAVATQPAHLPDQLDRCLRTGQGDPGGGQAAHGSVARLTAQAVLQGRQGLGDAGEGAGGDRGVRGDVQGPLDGPGVHLVGGLVGALLLGFFADATINPLVKNEGLFVGGDAKLLWYQFVASAATLVFSFVVSFIIAKAIDKTIGMRVTEEEENEGLDYSQHAETAYSFGSTGSMDRL